MRIFPDLYGENLPKALIKDLGVKYSKSMAVLSM